MKYNDNKVEFKALCELLSIAEILWWTTDHIIHVHSNRIRSTGDNYNRLLDNNDDYITQLLVYWRANKLC